MYEPKPGESDYDRAERLTAELLVRDARIVGLMAEIEELHRSVDARLLVERAKVLVMSATGFGPEAAFAALVARAQLEDRKLVERAKGIIQKKYNTTEEDAYFRLRNQSRRLRRSMRELAEAVILAEDIQNP